MISQLKVPTRSPWDALCALALLVLTVILSVREIIQVDPYFHLAAGRHILTHGFPHTNVFLQFNTDYPFVNHEWLYQLLVTGAYKLGGFTLLSLIKLGLVLLTLTALLTHRPARLRPLDWLLVTVFVFAAYPRFIVRPEVFSLLGIALHVFVLERLALSRQVSGGLCAALLVYFYLWVGCHGAYFLGIAVTLCYVAEALLGRIAALRRLGLRGHARSLKLFGGLLGAELLLSMATPYGLSGALYPFRKAAGASLEADKIVELESPFFSLGALTLDAQVYALLIALALVALVLALIKKRLRLAHLFLFLGMTVISVRFARLIPFGAAACLPLIASLPGSLRAMSWGRFARPARLLTLALTLALAAWGSFTGWRGQMHRNGLFENHMGLGASDFFQYQGAMAFWDQQPPQQNLFNPFGAGHYLLYARPSKEPKPFICGNADLYPGAFFEEYWAMMSGRASAVKLFDKYQISDVLLDHRNNPGPVQSLARDRRFSPVYLDHQVVIFRRAKAQASLVDELADAVLVRPREHPLVKGSERENFPYRKLHIAHMFSLWRHRPKALKAALTLARQLHRDHSSWIPALFLRARVEQDAGQRTSSWELYESLLARMPGDVRIRVATANAALIAGQLDKAIGHFERARAQGGLREAVERGLAQAYLSKGQLVELRRLLSESALGEEWKAYFRGRAAAREKDLDRALEYYQAAVKARADFSEALYLMGELHYKKRRFKAAIKSLEEVVGSNPSDGDALQYLGGSWFGLKEYRRAASCWEQAWASSQQRPLTALNIGDAWFRAGDDDQAIEWFRTARRRAKELAKGPAEKAMKDLAEKARALEERARRRQARRKDKD